MKRSEYSSKYALCIYKYKSYDLRDLRRCTKFECRHKLERNVRPEDITPSDHIRNILTDAFSLKNSMEIKTLTVIKRYRKRIIYLHERKVFDVWAHHQLEV